MSAMWLLHERERAAQLERHSVEQWIGERMTGIALNCAMRTQAKVLSVCPHAGESKCTLFQSWLVLSLLEPAQTPCAKLSLSIRCCAMLCCAMLCDASNTNKGKVRPVLRLLCLS